MLAGIKRFEHSYDTFDSRNASQAHLVFAEGDLPRNKVSGQRSTFVLSEPLEVCAGLGELRDRLVRLAARLGIPC